MMLVALAAGLTLVPMVTVDARDVRAGDLLRDGRGRPLAGASAKRVVLRLPEGQRQMTLRWATVAALVRRSGLTVTGNGPVTITRRMAAPVAATCWIARHALVAGQTVTIRDVKAGPCGGTVAAIGGANGQPVVRVAVPAGRSLGRFAPAAAGQVAPGTPLTLRSAAGVVTIERPVTTLQVGRSGLRVFVRDATGQVFAAPLALREDAR
ncbi:hypothetical protein N4G62_12295 [Sphingomonas sanguinis]|uniref:Flagella basal body P-ring formation protein FlgA C-terminal domain-containing protein n=1 Tax=Sphingomonas sanguinis TaxID=33051 RepID=A0ABU5LS90_9SPHN|nr:hypothetical protein [Sphingomonas sanguinis]MDZ7282808.1 hypothetical protein [Sphingomonas sanguinis]